MEVCQGGRKIGEVVRESCYVTVCALVVRMVGGGELWTCEDMVYHQQTVAVAVGTVEGTKLGN